MQLWNVNLRDHGLRSGARVRGISLGSDGPGQSCFIIPVKSPMDDEIDPNAWGLLPTQTQKPQIIANSDNREGTIALLSTFNRPGKRMGQIYVIDNGQLSRSLRVIGFGIGGEIDGGVRWEEAVVAVPNDGEANFYLANVGPPDTLISIRGKEVITTEIAPAELEDRIDGELIRIDDPRLVRWKAP